MGTLIQILQLLACLSLLVIVHEFGHFITAKMFGVRVEKFYLFFDMGHAIFSWKPKNSETEYGIGWLPLGGYVKLAGMIDESLDTKQMERPVQEWEFRAKPAWQRLIIMAAGVIMNVVAAITIYSMILFHYGEVYIPLDEVKLGMEYSDVAKQHGFVDGDILLYADGIKLEAFDEDNVRAIANAKEVTVLRNGKETTIKTGDNFMTDLVASKQGFAGYRIPFVIGGVIPSSPADRGGILTGDSIVSLNDSTYTCYSDLSAELKKHRNDSIRLGLYRNGEYRTVSFQLDTAAKMGVYVAPASMVYKTVTRNYGFLESFPAGIIKGFKTLTGYGSDFKIIFTKEGFSSMGGFGTITSLFPETFNAQAFWYITAYISIILAFMNILPIPALDGGHILFLLAEIVMRRKLSQKFLIRAQMAGLFIIMFLFLYANGMDLLRLLHLV